MMAAFLELGGYAAYVWPAYGLTALVLVLIFVAARAALRRQQARLAALEAETAGLRRHAAQTLGDESPS